jgi:hypothetical protein
MRPYLEKTHHKKGLVERLKVKALSSRPSITTKKKKAGLPDLSPTAQTALVLLLYAKPVLACAFQRGLVLWPFPILVLSPQATSPGGWGTNLHVFCICARYTCGQ